MSWNRLEQGQEINCWRMYAFIETTKVKPKCLTRSLHKLQPIKFHPTSPSTNWCSRERERERGAVWRAIVGSSLSLSPFFPPHRDFPYLGEHESLIGAAVLGTVLTQSIALRVFTSRHWLGITPFIFLSLASQAPPPPPPFHDWHTVHDLWARISPPVKCCQISARSMCQAKKKKKKEWAKIGQVCLKFRLSFTCETGNTFQF